LNRATAMRAASPLATASMSQPDARSDHAYISRVSSWSSTSRARGIRRWPLDHSGARLDAPPGPWSGFSLFGDGGRASGARGRRAERNESSPKRNARQPSPLPPRAPRVRGDCGPSGHFGPRHDGDGGTPSIGPLTLNVTERRSS
jgi:hypothetical protein